ncbi:MAG TPA: helix-turn-helix domain-containing protein [Micromonosporaceae bacterium]
MKEQGDTRTRIQDVALELFTEQGYEKTSLREIAERLGVTKAALYYHFKTKEDIVASLLADRVATMDDLIDWGRAQPRTAETRREILRRYADELKQRRHQEMMRFFERNQTAVHNIAEASKLRDRMLAILDLLAPPGAPATVRLRRALSIFALHASMFVLNDLDEDERGEAGLAVALDLVDTPGGTADGDASDSGTARRDPSGD